MDKYLNFNYVQNKIINELDTLDITATFLENKIKSNYITEKRLNNLENNVKSKKIDKLNISEEFKKIINSMIETKIIYNDLYVNIEKFYEKYTRSLISVSYENVKFKENTEDYECSICYNVFYNPIILDCKHTFCEQCIYQNKTKSCPLCRQRYGWNNCSFDKKMSDEIKLLTVVDCKHCNRTHTGNKYCYFFCNLCKYFTTDTIENNHIYNHCCDNGLIKYCFTCEQHIVKYKYEIHKKVCYDKYFYNNFIKLKLYNHDMKYDFVNNKLTYDKIKHLLDKNGEPRIYFLQEKVKLTIVFCIKSKKQKIFNAHKKLITVTVRQYLANSFKNRLKNKCMLYAKLKHLITDKWISTHARQPSKNILSNEYYSHKFENT
jgi:hypothetical protein